MGTDGDGADADEHSCDKVLGEARRNPNFTCQ